MASRKRMEQRSPREDSKIVCDWTFSPRHGVVPIDKVTRTSVVRTARAVIQRRGAMDTSKRVVNHDRPNPPLLAIVMGHPATDVTHGLAPALGDSPPVRHRPAVTTVEGVRDLWHRITAYEGADSPALRLLSSPAADSPAEQAMCGI